jgi:hypothetical protein
MICLMWGVGVEQDVVAGEYAGQYDAFIFGLFAEQGNG